MTLISITLFAFKKKKKVQARITWWNFDSRLVNCPGAVVCLFYSIVGEITVHPSLPESAGTTFLPQLPGAGTFRSRRPLKWESHAPLQETGVGFELTFCLILEIVSVMSLLLTSEPSTVCIFETSLLGLVKALDLLLLGFWFG